jgi:hypothetical protein
MSSEREEDEMLLMWLAMRRRGKTAREIEAVSGITVQLVINRTNDVLAADLSESGEPQGRVRGAYW